jgi:hypothetical protein
MSVNRKRPHVLVLPEDDANRQIALGFQLELDWPVQRRIQVLRPAGGWSRVLDAFEADHIGGMDRNGNRFLVLVIDFDEDVSRLAHAKGKIPRRMADRVFVLGVLSKPEKLKSVGLGAYEEIGSRMARDCREASDTVWSHELLAHNADELQRLRECVRPILF